MLNVYAGYIGTVDIDDVKVRCTDASTNIEQSSEFYDHIIGLRDSIPSSGSSTKTDAGNVNYQKYIWRPGVRIVNGNVSFPMTKEAFRKVWDLARKADSFTMIQEFTCGIRRTFSNCKVSSFNFNATAGDIVNCSVSIMSNYVEEDSTTTKAPANITSQKLITWDVIAISTPISSNAIQALDFTVDNPCKPIYTSGNLWPREIRIGMQEMTGTITFYTKGNDLTLLTADSASTYIDLDIDGIERRLNVIFMPIQRSGSINAQEYPLGFVGAGKAMN